MFKTPNPAIVPIESPANGSVGARYIMPGEDRWRDDASLAAAGCCGGGIAGAANACAQCGVLLTEENFVAAKTITVRAAQTRRRVASGQDVITIVGGLELKTPPWAIEMHEYPYRLASRAVAGRPAHRRWRRSSG